MSLYYSILPRAGFAGFIVQKEVARMAAVLLVEEDEENAPNGSSFAITADTTREGWRTLWLTHASIRRLLNDDRFYNLHEFLKDELTKARRSVGQEDLEGGV